MQNNKCSFFFIFLLVSSMKVDAQSNLNLLRQGNKSFDKKQYNTAETYYRKALAKDSTQVKGLYNLGNAQYKQNLYDESLENYNKALQNPL
ncbi:MAG: tetratricopeptide repeat protein, partial [Bacteroidales bacterium]